MSHGYRGGRTHGKQVAAVKDVPQNVADNVGPELPWQLLQQLSLMYLCIEILTLTSAATILLQLLLCSFLGAHRRAKSLEHHLCAVMPMAKR